MQIDPQYIVGFTWQRAYGFRVAQSLFDNKLAVGCRGGRTANNAWRPRLQHLYERHSGDFSELLSSTLPEAAAASTTLSTRPATPTNKAPDLIAKSRLIRDGATTNCSASSALSGRAFIPAPL